ncbi:MAG: hypothetical protein R2941_06300 [Desulfobacterales bacterium]
MKKDVLKIFGEVLRNYDNLADKTDISLFVKDQLRIFGACTDQFELETAAADICNTIDDIDAAFQDLVHAKEIGKSRNAWLETQLEEFAGSLPEDEKIPFIQEMKTAMVQSEAELLKTGEQTHPPLSEPLKNDEFKDLNKKAIAQNIESDIRNNTLLKVITAQEIIKFDPAKEYDEIPSVKDFFQRPLDHPEDKNIKKIVSAATVAARNRGWIKSLEKQSVKEISAIADLGVSGAKVAYKVGTGEINSTDAIDYMVDRATATFAAVAKKAVPSAAASAGVAIGTVIGSVFGPTGAYVGAEWRSVRYAGKAVAPVIEQG